MIAGPSSTLTGVALPTLLSVPALRASTLLLLLVLLLLCCTCEMGSAAERRLNEVAGRRGTHVLARWAISWDFCARRDIVGVWKGCVEGKTQFKVK